MRAALVVVVLAGLGRPALAQEHGESEERLGTVHFPTSCRADVQPRFDRAIAYLHSFAFTRANEGFRAVLAADSSCAMAYWGLAVAAWGNPFAAGIKPPAAIARGLDAVTRARAVSPATDRERGYVDAVARLYQRADVVNQGARVIAYRDAMGALAAREPADTEAAIFHAVAQVFAADPADKTYAGQLAAGSTLERLFAVLPDHPGLAHYIIHAYDVPALAARALDAAHRYGHIAPAVSHALHMPSHTYTRVGAWQESIDANIASAAASRREGAGAEGLHASDYETYAYLQLARDRAARAMVVTAESLGRALDPNATMTGAPPAAGHFARAAIPARYALERGAWAEAARLEVHPSPIPFADAITWFARGLGAARSGDTAAAQEAVGELARLRDTLTARRESYWAEQVDIQRAGASAWLDFAAGRQDAALAAMQAAAAREDATEKNAITPGPLAPARELYGEMLLAARRPTEALAAFEATLRHEPNRFRALAGAARAARAAGDTAASRRYDRLLLELGSHADRPLRPELVEAARRE
jgi:hypothetical protein